MEPTQPLEDTLKAFLEKFVDNPMVYFLAARLVVCELFPLIMRIQEYTNQHDCAEVQSSVYFREDKSEVIFLIKSNDIEKSTKTYYAIYDIIEEVTTEILTSGDIREAIKNTTTEDLLNVGVTTSESQK